MWNWVKRLVSWVRPSFEGDDGKLSYRRASAFIILAVIVRMAEKGFINGFQITALQSFIVFFLVLTAIITVDQAIKWKNGK